MRFNKHQRDIIKAINNKEVYDIESFVKKFKLYEHFIVDKEKIKKAFDESESGKVYPVDVVKNLLEHENKRRISVPAKLEYTENKKKVTFNNCCYEYDLWDEKGFYIAIDYDEIVAVELDTCTLKRDELKAKKKEKSKEYDEIEKKIKHVRNDIRKEEKQYAERAQLIGTTISCATVDPIFDSKQFDLVMFDEVSMAYVPQVIAAAALSKGKFLCVGDFRQLAPISQCPDSQLLKKDIFSYLKIIDGTGHMYWHPWLVMLNEQRRMHPDIAGFSNKYIYKRLLQNHKSVEDSRNAIVQAFPLPGDAMNLIDIAGTYCAADKNTDGSRFNILSAIIAFSTAVCASQQTVENVGIITPYAAQTRLIRAMLKDYTTRKESRISCATVHQFQGSESDIIIFDAVESYPKSAVGYLMGKDPDNIARLINVAVTRAKGKLITVANDKFWDNLYTGTNHIFYKLLNKNYICLFD